MEKENKGRGLLRKENETVFSTFGLYCASLFFFSNITFGVFYFDLYILSNLKQEFIILLNTLVNYF